MVKRTLEVKGRPSDENAATASRLRIFGTLAMFGGTASVAGAVLVDLRSFSGSPVPGALQFLMGALVREKANRATPPTPSR